MAFRNVVITERCKLEYSLNYLICRKGNEEKKVLLDEIKIIIVLSTQVSITSSLIVMLSKHKIKLMFCDSLHNPECEMIPYFNNYYSYRKIKEQMEFVNENANHIWKQIIQEKIKNQAKNLKFKNLIEQYNLLIQYSMDVDEGDTSNREGHSAKVYFNALFGNDFNRNQDNCINKYLNYGYSRN